MESHKDVAFIEQLFYNQIKNVTQRQLAKSFEKQHSDVWI